MSEPDLNLQSGVPLATHTTLCLGGPAAHFVQATQPEHVAQAVSWAGRRGLPVLVLGGGSNVVVADAGFPGLVIQMATKGVVAESTAAGIEVQVAAGELWDPFVAFATAQGWSGVECLGGIPGCVGATPIQNVGAYGQEVSQTITRVRVLDRKTLQTQWVTPKALAFGYRDSWLRRNLEAMVVLDVVFCLQAQPPAKARYAELERALAGVEDPSSSPSPEHIRQTVIALRRKKSMVLDPTDPNTRSAGSFFTNPIVDRALAARVGEVALQRNLVQSAAEFPQWPAEQGRVKLSAGWLIERAGFARGQRQGAVGISSAHALALVHHGGGTASELVALARQIQAGVEQQFGVTLAPEPVFVGLQL